MSLSVRTFPRKAAPFFATLSLAAIVLNAQTDPGVRSGPAAAGGALPGLSVKEAKFFDAGLDEFQEIASISGTIAGTEPGLGPRFNHTNCAACHAHPAIGGSSPAMNPQFTAAPQKQLDVLTLNFIISPTGPVREVRFVKNLATGKPDGGVHALFTIADRSDTPANCKISQPDFTANKLNMVFRIPTPAFGAGLIEAIDDSVILANEKSGKPFGIGGHANRNGNDGTVTRFGWKAQNKSLVIFSGEAYNVEQGVTNDLFPDERGEGGQQDSVECRVNATPEDHVHYDLTQPQTIPANTASFANFMRFLAAPEPVLSYTSANVGPVSASAIASGFTQFKNVGCPVCHVVSLTTGHNSSAALSGKTANLYSDLLVHDMGSGLADGISQGNAGGNEFRTAPLWGLGQRIFFLHDGRTPDLHQAILAHGGEAATVVGNYQGLTTDKKNDLLKFLRSL